MLTTMFSLVALHFVREYGSSCSKWTTSRQKIIYAGCPWALLLIATKVSLYSFSSYYVHDTGAVDHSDSQKRYIPDTGDRYSIQGQSQRGHVD